MLSTLTLLFLTLSTFALATTISEANLGQAANTAGFTFITTQGSSFGINIRGASAADNFDPSVSIQGQQLNGLIITLAPQGSGFYRSGSYAHYDQYTA